LILACHQSLLEAQLIVVCLWLSILSLILGNRVLLRRLSLAHASTDFGYLAHTASYARTWYSTFDLGRCAHDWLLLLLLLLNLNLLPFPEFKIIKLLLANSDMAGRELLVLKKFPVILVIFTFLAFNIFNLNVVVISCDMHVLVFDVVQKQVLIIPQVVEFIFKVLERVVFFKDVTNLT
jgi:hypothetical protein